MDEVVSPEIVPAVEDWLINANKKGADDNSFPQPKMVSDL